MCHLISLDRFTTLSVIFILIKYLNIGGLRFLLHCAVKLFHLNLHLIFDSIKLCKKIITYQFSYVYEFSPSDWWRIVKRIATRQGDIGATTFCQFMIGLHSCPASSAGIERFFSTVGFIWSKTRNRLGVQKAQKLATVYRALRPLPNKPVAEQEQSDANATD